MDDFHPKLGKFPVIGLKSDYSTMPVSELMVFRAARAKLTEATMSPWLRRRLTRAWLLYPVFLVSEILIPWLKYSRVANRAFGHPPLKQLLEVSRLTLNDGLCGRKGYYLGGLAEHRGGPELERYIHDQFHECLVIFCRYAVRQIDGPQPDLGDKATLERKCIAAGLPCVRSFATITPADEIIYHGDTEPADLDRESAIFVKPAEGGQGKNTERWDRAGSGYVNSAGSKADSLDALLNLLQSEARSIGRKMLLQQALSNGPAARAYGSRALSTVRLVTFRTHKGDVIPVQAAMRVGTRHEAAVDNYHAAGLLFHVDYKTGEIGEGFSTEFASRPARHSAAPLTGMKLTGTKIPRWREFCKLAVRAHRTLTTDTICGWDLAETDEGQMIIECNMVPGTDVAAQQPEGGFLHTHFSQLLCEEIIDLLNRIEPEGSCFRINTG